MKLTAQTVKFIKYELSSLVTIKSAASIDYEEKKQN